MKVLTLQSSKSIFAFGECKILELVHMHSLERYAIPDDVDVETIYWIIGNFLHEIKHSDIDICNGYAWISNRIRNAFFILWGQKTQITNFQYWEDKRPTIILNWTQSTIEEVSNGKKISFRNTAI